MGRAAKPAPPTTLIAADSTPSYFGVYAGAAAGYQPLSVAGKRSSIGAEVDVSFRRGRLDIAAGVVIAPIPGIRVAIGWAVLAQRVRLDAAVQGAAFPGVGLYGGGATVGLGVGLNSIFALQARGGAEVYPTQGTVIVAVLGSAGVAARF